MFPGEICLCANRTDDNSVATATNNTVLFFITDKV